MSALSKKNILFGITGSIAAYKAVDIVRALIKEDAVVTVVMTEAACRFIPPLTLEAVSGRRVHTGLFEDFFSHLNLSKDSHLFIIAPATANTINKLASGIADNLLTSAWLAYKGLTVIAPAMNWRMYEHPIVKKSIRELGRLGATFAGPVQGSLACGEEGAGRMADTEDIIEAARAALTPKDLKGRRILVTAGPTREPLDAVRFISNRSSGKMGFAVARAALRRGANVTLISGPSSQRPPHGADFIPVETTDEMRNTVLKKFTNATAIIMTSAVSDFAPAVNVKSKIKKTDAMMLNLKKTPDILKELGRKKGERILIGFAAEAGKDVRSAREKLRSKNLDWIVLNDVTEQGAGFDADTNIVTIIGKKGDAVDYPLMHKDAVADVILDRLLRLQPNRKETKGRRE